MIKPEILRDIQWNAMTQRGGGAAVDIDYSRPTVAIELSDGNTFFFQGEEAFELLAEASVSDEVAIEDMILWLARGW